MIEEVKRTAISISILGESTVGKTCICCAFLGLEFLDEYLSTVGIEKMCSMLELENGKKLKVKLWDTAGQERFRSVSINTLKNSQATIVVFDLTNKTTFSKVKYWLKEIRGYSTKMPVCLFGNKSDLQNREVTQDEIDNLCHEENLTYFETSAKENKGISEGITKIVNIAYKLNENESFSKGQPLKKIDINNSNKKKKKKCC